MSQEPAAAPYVQVVVPLVALVVMQLAASAAFVTVQVVAPEVGRAHGLPAALIGVFTAIAYAGAMVGGTLTGPLMARLGTLRAGQAALVVCAAGLGATTFGHAAALVLGALVLGAGHGPVTPIGSHVLMRWTPPAVRSSVFSIKQAAVPLGGMVAGALVPWLAVAWRWERGIQAMALLCLLVALALQPLRRWLEDERRLAVGGPAWRAMAAAVRDVVAHPPLREVVLASCVFGALQWGFTAFYVAFLVDEQGLDLVTAGLAFSLSQAVGIGGRILWGIVTDRTDRPIRVLVGLGLAMALASLALALSRPGWPPSAVVAVAAAIGLTAISWNGVAIAEAARLALEGRVAVATAGFVGLFAATTILVPILLALLALSGTYAYGFALLALACLASALRLRRLGDRPT